MKINSSDESLEQVKTALAVKGTPASNYAAALLDLAREEGPDRIDQELKLVSQTLSSHLKLKEALNSSQVSLEKKQALVNEIFGLKLSKTTLGFLSLLLATEKISLLPEIATEYTLLLQQVENKIIAEVATAVPVDNAILSHLENRLVELTGKRVSIRHTVDESIVGGLIIRVDGKLIDASVRGQLNKLKESMLKDVRKVR